VALCSQNIENKDFAKEIKIELNSLESTRTNKISVFNNLEVSGFRVAASWDSSD
jgi:hypothetical protein